MAGETVLVNISGDDQPGMLAMLTSTLSEYQVQVLDVGQAIIHDDLALGMLIRVPEAADTAQVVKALLFKAHEQGITARFTPVSASEYHEWVAHQSGPRWIVTLMAAGLYAGQLASVTTRIRDHGLNIESIRRLSGRVPLSGVGGDTCTCIEMSVRGDLKDPDGLKSSLLAASLDQKFDFSVQADTVYRRTRRLVAFDMDSTLIDAEVIDELAKLHGVGERVAAITERAMRGELGFQDSLRARVRLLAGLPTSAMAEVADRVSLNPGADRLIRALKHFGYRTAIVSGGFQYVGDKLAGLLGIDDVFANQLGVADGAFTGDVVGEIVDADRKARILEDLCRRQSISLEQAIAIGDGANDLPMLSAAGLGVAYHAKPVVQESASHAISNFGLDSVLYLIGFSDRDLEQAGL